MKKLILISIVFLFGCVTEKKREKICAKCPVKEFRTDSTVYKEYWNFRDSVLNVLPDSAQIEYIVSPCPDGSIPPIKQTYKRDGRKTKLKGTVKNGKINIGAEVGPEQLKFQIRERDRLIEKLRNEVKVLPCPKRTGEDLFYYSGIGAYILAGLILAGCLIWLAIKKNKK